MTSVKLEAALLCDEIRVEDNGKWSLIGLWEYLSAPAFPAHSRFAVFSRWRKVKGEKPQALPREVYIRLQGPVQAGDVGAEGGGTDDRSTNATADALAVLTTKARVSFDPFVGVYSHRAYFEVDFPVPGEYQLEFYFDDVLAHVQPFEVIPEGT